jgi:hypothetical protein
MTCPRTIYSTEGQKQVLLDTTSIRVETVPPEHEEKHALTTVHTGTFSTGL